MPETGAGLLSPPLKNMRMGSLEPAGTGSGLALRQGINNILHTVLAHLLGALVFHMYALSFLLHRNDGLGGCRNASQGSLGGISEIVLESPSGHGVRHSRHRLLRAEHSGARSGEKILRNRYWDR